ncbi:hypothetical protein KUCAC02_006995 [Chaenocephalus aceratus]|nr:hypothetical protein KUCAC02_006995 [Chaenocephalus aceratus]
MAGPSKKAKNDIALTPKRKRTFIETWKTQFPWSHESSKYHLLCIQRKEVTEKGTGPMFVALKKQAENMDDQLKPMFNTAFYVAKLKLPFRSFEGLIELQENNGIKKADTLPERQGVQGICTGHCRSREDVSL